MPQPVDTPALLRMGKKPGSALPITIAATALLVCLVCLVLLVGGTLLSGRFPGLSGLLASPTPQGIAYTNNELGFSLFYPVGWILEEMPNAVVFATSQEMIDYSNFPETGAELIVLRDPTFVDRLAGSINLSDPEEVLVASVNEAGASIEVEMNELEAVHGTRLAHNPAAAGVFSYRNDNGVTAVVYAAVILPAGTPIIVLGICPQVEWSLYRPAFDSILASLTLQADP